MMRRKLNPKFDSKPSIHHEFNYKIARPYIRNKKVLDIGCWTGQFEKLAIKTVEQILGIDLEKEVIDCAKKLVPEAAFRVGSALNLPFSNKSFDCIVLLDVIEHLPLNTENKALGEIKRVLKPKGYLILSTPSNHIFSILLDPAFFLIGHRHYSIKKIKKLLQNQGFKIVKIYKTGGIYCLFSNLTQILVKHLINKKINFSAKFKEKIKNEYLKGGFVQIHIIAKNQKQ